MEQLPDDSERFLGPAVARHQSHLPVLDQAPVFEPFIRVAEKDHSGQSAAEGVLNLPREDLAFPHFALAQRIDAEFAEHERFGVRHHLESREIILKRALLMEVNVEADEVGTLRLQELGGWKICERANALRIRPFGLADQFIDKVRDGAGAGPTHDV